MSTKEQKELHKLRKALREAVANYMWSEGCSCCRDTDVHDAHKERIAELLHVPKQKGWYDFSKYRSKKK